MERKLFQKKRYTSDQIISHVFEKLFSHYSLTSSSKKKKNVFKKNTTWT